jgi:hypothetical protein
MKISLCTRLISLGQKMIEELCRRSERPSLNVKPSVNAAVLLGMATLRATMISRVLSENESILKRAM